MTRLCCVGLVALLGLWAGLAIGAQGEGDEAESLPRPIGCRIELTDQGATLITSSIVTNDLEQQDALLRETLLRTLRGDRELQAIQFLDDSVLYGVKTTTDGETDRVILRDFEKMARERRAEIIRLIRVHHGSDPFPIPDESIAARSWASPLTGEDSVFSSIATASVRVMVTFHSKGPGSPRERMGVAGLVYGVYLNGSPELQDVVVTNKDGIAFLPEVQHPGKPSDFSLRFLGG